MNLQSSLNYYNYALFDASTIFEGENVANRTNEDVVYCEKKKPRSLCEQGIREPGFYSLGATTEHFEQHCTLYIRAPDPLQTIEIEITSIKYICEDNDEHYLRIFDGWRYPDDLNIPRTYNSSKTLQERIHKMCNQKGKTITLSQNIGQIEYRIKRKGFGIDFKFKLRFSYNVEPCDQVYFLQNDDPHKKPKQIKFRILNRNLQALACTAYILHDISIPFSKHIRDSYEYSGLDIHFKRYELAEKSKHRHVYDPDDSCTKDGAKYYIKIIGDHDVNNLFKQPNLRGYEICGNQNEYLAFHLEFCWNVGIQLVSTVADNRATPSLIEVVVNPLKSFYQIPAEDGVERAQTYYRASPPL
ncbi:hypothetical protein BLA29_005405, partial [Euroglyphus maynei]